MGIKILDMMLKKLFFIVCFLPIFVSAQENWIEHNVAQNETVLAIAEKYKVNTSEIYRYNRFAIDSISDGMVLKFPVPADIKHTETKTQTVNEIAIESEIGNEITTKETSFKESIENIEIVTIEETEKKPVGGGGFHFVKHGETLFGLARQYNTTVEAIKHANQNLLKRGLQAGEKIMIPYLSGTVIAKTVEENKSEKVSTQTIIHEVKAGETLYGLSKKYNLTIDEIKDQNPKISKKGLQTGQVLTLKLSEN